MHSELDIIEGFWDAVSTTYLGDVMEDGRSLPSMLVAFAMLGMSTTILTGIALVRDCLDGDFRYLIKEEPWDEQPKF